jgi:hypothetical protein
MGRLQMPKTLSKHWAGTPVCATHASIAWLMLYVPCGTQSSYVSPRPLECTVWQVPPGQQLGVEHSQPSVSGALLALQSERPAAHW